MKYQNLQQQKSPQLLQQEENKQSTQNNKNQNNQKMSQNEISSNQVSLNDSVINEMKNVKELHKRNHKNNSQLSISSVLLKVLGILTIIVLLIALMVLAVDLAVHKKAIFQRDYTKLANDKKYPLKSQAENIKKNSLKIQDVNQKQKNNLQNEKQTNSKQNKTEQKVQDNQQQKNQRNTSDNKKQELNNQKGQLKPKQKYPLRTSSKLHQPMKTDNDKYDFSKSIKDMAGSGGWLQRQIKQMGLIHNVDFNGNIVLDNIDYYSSAEQKYKDLEKVILDQKAYFQGKYQISKYMSNQIRFCVFVPSFNNARLRYYMRNLDSIFQQDYNNYHVVYVNDASKDNLGQHVQHYMNDNQIPPEYYTIVNNKENQGLVGNTYMAAHEYCQEGEVMILLDGDDSLIGRQVLSLLNAVYQKEKIGIIYTQFLVIHSNSQVSGGFCRQIPKRNLENGTFRKLRSFFTSHLKSMYVDIFRKIKRQDLQDNQGKFYRYAADVCYMTPMIQMVGTRIKFVQQVNYEYRYDTGLNDPGSEQRRVEMQIYDKPAYTKLDEMPFADNPKTKFYE